MRPRLEAELLGESVSRRLQGCKSLCLSPRAIEREHELTEEALSEWMVAYEGLQLGYQLVAAAELQVGVDPVLERQESALFQPLCLARSERFVEDVRQCGTPPQGERGPKGIRGLSRSSANNGLVTASVEALETVEVELAGLDAKQVARGTCHEAAFAERLAHPRDGGVERMACARGRAFSPQPVDQAVTRDRLVRVEEKEGEQHALLRPTERKLTAVVQHLDGAENPELHRRM